MFWIESNRKNKSIATQMSLLLVRHKQTLSSVNTMQSANSTEDIFVF